jgi:hypothetical protein
MGDKRISKRTLDNGETVWHHPPCDEHPEGKQVLHRESSSVRDRLDAQLAENKRRHAEIKDAHTESIDAKKSKQQEKGLPAEKSPI